MSTSPLRQRPWWRALLSVLASLLAYAVMFAVSVLASGELMSLTGPRNPNGTPVPGTLSSLLGLLAVLLELSVFARRRAPWLVWGIGVAVVVGLQLDGVLMLVAMSQIVADRPLRQWRAAAIGSAALGIWLIVRNALLPGSWLMAMSPDVHNRAVTVGVDTLLFTLAYAVCFGLGWIRRSRRHIAYAESRAEKAQQQARGLSEKLDQQSERERLAQEIHDALAHRLSLVSLHSGALEEAIRSGGDVAEAAKVVRDNAHRSLEDLRDLVGALRNEHEAGPVDEPARVALNGMADVTEVIDSTAATGIQVNAFVMLSEPDSASEVLNRAVFRIVQESLTNVVKHAPGSTVGLDLRAAPQTGVSLLVRNRITVDTDIPGSGAGVIGMRERVAALGGQISVGPTDDGWFTVDVRLPWRPRGGPAD